MLYSLLGPETFYVAVTALALAFGRAVKAVATKVPPAMLPWMVLGFAFGLVLGDALAGGAPLRDAAMRAVVGLTSGAVAVGAHETAKGALVGMFGPEMAERLLGKLRGGQ